MSTYVSQSAPPVVAPGAKTGTMGFRARIPEHWSKVWVVMWLVSAPAVVVLAFFLPFWEWVAVALVGFLVPEMISNRKQGQGDRLPPLTHTIRHFLPNWVAFPLIYFALGSVGAHWLGVSPRFGVGGLLGLLGWLTDRFIGVYARPDAFPSGQASRW